MHFLLLLLTLQHLCWGSTAQVFNPFIYNITDGNHTIANAETITKRGCPKKCGNLTVPYPFGIVTEGLSCPIDPLFNITCNYSTDPPKAFITTSNLQVYDISNSELRISNFLSSMCYTSGEGRGYSSSVSLGETPYMYSKANVLTVVGCDDFAELLNAPEGYLPKGCTSTCQNC